MVLGLGLRYGTTERNFDRLQRVQNTLARVVFRASWSASAPDLLRELYWLTTRQQYREAAFFVDKMGEGKLVHISAKSVWGIFGNTFTVF